MPNVSIASLPYSQILMLTRVYLEQVYPKICAIILAFLFSYQTVQKQCHKNRWAVLHNINESLKKITADPTDYERHSSTSSDFIIHYTLNFSVLVMIIYKGDILCKINIKWQTENIKSNIACCLIPYFAVNDRCFR